MDVFVWVGVIADSEDTTIIQVDELIWVGDLEDFRIETGVEDNGIQFCLIFGRDNQIGIDLNLIRVYDFRIVCRNVYSQGIESLFIEVYVSEGN